MRFDLVLASWTLFADGVWMTLQLTFVPILIGACIAIPAALALVRRVPFVSPLVGAFTYLIRGTPLLVQTFVVYYGLAQFEVVRASWAWVFLRDPWWCAVISFSLSAAGYWIVIIAGAIETTPIGEREAADALGLSRRQATWLVLIPSVMRRILPQVGNEVIMMLHASALASVITIQDILGAARTFNARHYLGSDGLIVAAALYLALTIVVVGLFVLIERRYLRHLAPRGG